jgi:predicted RNA-binding protein with PIN domain
MTPPAPGRRRWLVDGMNVIGSRPDGWWRDRTRAMRRLTADLDALARETGEPVTVVFDGARREIGSERVEVRFARRRGPNAADDDIAALAASDADPGSLRVVTSDAGLAERVRPAGVGLVGAGEFRRRLDAIAPAAREEPDAGGRTSEP